jgi:gas vesicle protein
MDHYQTYINDANDIWRDLRQRASTDQKFMALSKEEQLDYYQRSNAAFHMMFPIVIRYMVMFGQYSTRAFTRHVKKIGAKPYRSEDEYCERQADYVKYLFMELSPAHDSKEAKAVWQQTYDKLKLEVESFKEARKNAQETLKANDAKSSAERRNELRKAILVNLQ